jgi:hypothetical protein
LTAVDCCRPSTPLLAAEIDYSARQLKYGSPHPDMDSTLDPNTKACFLQEPESKSQEGQPSARSVDPEATLRDHRAPSISERPETQVAACQSARLQEFMKFLDSLNLPGRACGPQDGGKVPQDLIDDDSWDCTSTTKNRSQDGSETDSSCSPSSALDIKMSQLELKLIMSASVQAKLERTRRSPPQRKTRSSDPETDRAQNSIVTRQSKRKSCRKLLRDNDAEADDEGDGGSYTEQGIDDDTLSLPVSGRYDTWPLKNQDLTRRFPGALITDDVVLLRDTRQADSSLFSHNSAQVRPVSRELVNADLADGIF